MEDVLRETEMSHVSHDRKQEGQSQSAGVYQFRPHACGCCQATSERKHLIVLVQPRLAFDERRDVEVKSRVRSGPSITHAPLIMIKCCQAADRNSKVYLAPNGRGDMSSVSPTSDRVSNGSY